jgi:pimeloyl-ACP methyl ester carboxylesterase
MPSISSNGIRLEYAESGDPADPVILLIMGLGTQLVAWPDALCNGLVGLGFRVIRFDNRDVGHSTKNQTLDEKEVGALALKALGGKPFKPPYTLHDMAADALGLLDGLGVAKAHIVGISMGGMIAQIMAAEHADRVLSLTLIMTHSGNPKLPPGKPEAMAALFAPRPDGSDPEAVVAHTMKTYRVIGSPGYRMSDPELRAWVERSTQRAHHPLGAGMQLLAVLGSAPRVDLVKKISSPTLVMHGIDDPLVPVEAGKELAELIPGATLKLIPGMGHDLAAGLMPLWVDAIGRHCLAAAANDEQGSPPSRADAKALR